MINLNSITEIKFINYFKDKTPNKNDYIFNLFLEEMNNLIEKSDIKIDPLKDLKTLMNRFNYTSLYFTHIEDLIHSLNVLTSYELFLLLYFSSCRNSFTYDETFYIQSIKNGNIYNILLEIKDRINNI